MKISEERIASVGFGYNFDFNGNRYSLIHDHSEDRSCNYYFQLSRNNEPIQRSEIVPTRKRTPAFYLVALFVVAAFPVAAGEFSEQFTGISALEWSADVKLTVIATAALSAIAIHLALYGRLLIKNLTGPDQKG